MSSSPSTREPVCFTCGLPVGEPLRLNHLPGGQSCPACRDRLLEALPAPFSARLSALSPSSRASEERGEAYEDELFEPVRVRPLRERGPEPA